MEDLRLGHLDGRLPVLDDELGLLDPADVLLDLDPGDLAQGALELLLLVGTTSAMRSPSSGWRTSCPFALHCSAKAASCAWTARTEPFGGVRAVTPAAFSSLQW